MEVNVTDKRLAFVRRMIWWLPALVFAIVAAVSVSFNPLSGGTVFGAVLGALVPAVVIAVLCAAVYFGYKYMLSRTPNT